MRSPLNLKNVKPLLALPLAGLLAAGLVLNLVRPAKAGTLGYVSARSVQSYTVYLQAGQYEQISAVGDGDIDLEVRCPEHNVVVDSDFDRDNIPVCTFVAPESGTYTIRVINTEFYGVDFDLTVRRVG